jgi:hypothetical protein
MNVIRCSACGDEREALAASDAAQVGIKLGCSGCGNERAAIFGAENTMNEIARVRVRHLAPSLRDSDFTTAISIPALKRWANKHCAYGADPRENLRARNTAQPKSAVNLLMRRVCEPNTETLTMSEHEKEHSKNRTKEQQTNNPDLQCSTPVEYLAFRILMYPEVGNHSGSSSHARGETNMASAFMRNKPKNRHKNIVISAATRAC